MLLASLICGVALAADKPLDVRDVMTASQFHATGLDKLTPEQMAAFNAWLASYAHTPAAATAGAGTAMVAPLPVPTPAAAAAVPAAPAAAVPTPAPSAASTGSFGKEMLTSEQRGEPTRIESRILGTFKGWNGRSVFKLENGQVWQQADTSTYDITLQDPPVVIKRLGFGYLMTLPGHGATVFVKRVH
jgi:hypothetical protein